MKIKVNITEKEKAIVEDAVNNHNRVIIPANDNIDILCILYRIKLIAIDFKNDVFFVNENGRGLVC
jgi:3-dehydroquinate synthase class II